MPIIRRDNILYFNHTIKRKYTVPSVLIWLIVKSETHDWYVIFIQHQIRWMAASVHLIQCCTFTSRRHTYIVLTLKPHFCIIKLGFTRIYIIFLISAQKHRLWVLEAVLTSTQNLCFEQEYEKHQNFLSENCPFFGCKISIYLNRHVFVMLWLFKHVILTTFFYSICLLIYLSLKLIQSRPMNHVLFCTNLYTDLKSIKYLFCYYNGR